MGTRRLHRPGAAVAALLLGACFGPGTLEPFLPTDQKPAPSGGGTNAPDATTNYGSRPGDTLIRGTIAGKEGTSGTLTVVLKEGSTDAATTAEARVDTLDGETVNLTGTVSRVTPLLDEDGQPVLDPLTGEPMVTAEVDLAGEGWSLDGTLTGQALDGSFTSPEESGTFSGLDSTDNAVRQFCGTFSGSESGTWNLQVTGQRASGSFAGSRSGQLGGFLNGTSLALRLLGGTATGAVDGNGASGTWEAETWSGDVLSGSWTGRQCGGASSGGGTVGVGGSGGGGGTAADCCKPMPNGGEYCPIHGC